MSGTKRIHVVLGTAGHIDHGKTTLIRAITGKNTDRLPEEKKRGITIVLGFAPLPLPDGSQIGVIDVPGHERFVKNMVSGAAGIDFVLLVVAADEGVMPQTREHVEICQLLGIRRGIVALTKIDRAEPDLLEMAAEDVAEYLAETSLASAPIIKCSATTGEGIEELKASIQNLVAECERDNSQADMVLPVDRTFSVKGFGSVVTGTLLSGQLKVGDAVQIIPPVPGRPAPESIKVRSVQVFGDSVEQAFSGDRTAVSLPGVELDQLSRGQMLVPPGLCEPSRRVDVRVHYLSSRSKKLKSGAKVIFHLGTSIVNGQVTLLNADRLDPGESSFARIRLEEPVVALPNQRFILRGFDAMSTAGRTIGGGVILDPQPPRRKRHATMTEESLTALEQALGDPAAWNLAMSVLAKEAGQKALEIPSLAKRFAKTEKFINQLIDKAVKNKGVIKVGQLCISSEAIQSFDEKILALIQAFHTEHPFKPAMSLNELKSRMGRQIPKAIVERAAKSLVGKKKLSQQSEGFHLPEHRPFGAAGAEAKENVMKLLREAGLQPPTFNALQTEADIDKKSLREMMTTLAKTEDVIRVTPELFFDAQAYAKFQEQVLGFIRAEGEITTAQAKTLTGLSRKFLIPLLESLDKRRVTVRVGEARKAR
ncbi:MAG: selenocysteine-specific translation elongation factor [Myxococcota bacterium]|nr:selenocysteine-specific translation elongation factor [Myxococcota bacterium]